MSGPIRGRKSTEKLFRYFRASSLLKAVSYSTLRLSSQETMEILPEIATIENHFHAKSLETWNEELRIHNKLIARGLTMGLNKIDSLDRLSFASLDLFLIKTRGGMLADVLNAYSSFAERFIDDVNSDRHALLWSVFGPVIITNERWMNLCKQMVNILKLIDFEDISDTDCPCPDYQLLERSAIRARVIFSNFAVADEPLPLLHVPSATTSQAYSSYYIDEEQSQHKRRRLPPTQRQLMEF
jgi:hypothetical protein